jgi:hypothetical protein
VALLLIVGGVASKMSSQERRSQLGIRPAAERAATVALVHRAAAAVRVAMAGMPRAVVVVRLMLAAPVTLGTKDGRGAHDIGIASLKAHLR